MSGYLKEMSLETPDFLSDLASLKKRIVDSGFTVRPHRVALQWLMLVGLSLGTLGWLVTSHSLSAQIPLFFVSCFALISAGTAAHTASHGALSSKKWVNRFAVYVTYPLIFGMSARYWHRSHIEIHHPAPNVLENDDDCDLRPVFAIHQTHHQQAGTLRRWFYRFQVLLLVVLIPANGFNIQRQGWQALVKELGDPRRRKMHTWADLACMVAHWGLWLAIPMFFFPLQSVVVLYLLRTSFMGILLFVVLAPGHYPAEAQCLSATAQLKGTFFLRQAACTVNFRTGLLGGILCSGLQYQIEHHLFPGLSHIHYAKLSPHLTALCARHGIPHRTLGWGEAIYKSFRVFVYPKVVIDDVRDLERGTAPTLSPASP